MENNNSSYVGNSTITVNTEYRKAMELLKNAEFDKADAMFDAVLRIDPEYAPAYIGKLCASHNLTSEAQIADLGEPIDDDANYLCAVRCANPIQRTLYINYSNTILARIKRIEYNENLQKEAASQRRNEEALEKGKMIVIDSLTKETYSDLIERSKAIILNPKPATENHIELTDIARELLEYGEYFEFKGHYEDARKWAENCQAVAAPLKKKQETRESIGMFVWCSIALLFFIVAIIIGIAL